VEKADSCARFDVILFWFMQPTPNTWTNGFLVVVVERDDVDLDRLLILRQMSGSGFIITPFNPYLFTVKHTNLHILISFLMCVHFITIISFLKRAYHHNSLFSFPMTTILI